MILSLYKYLYFYIFGTLFQLIIILCQNVSRIFYLFNIVRFYSRICLRTVCTIHSTRINFCTRCRNREKAACFYDSFAKHKLFVAAWQTAWNRNNKTIPEKQNRYSSVSVITRGENVSLKKNIALCCVALYEIYTSILARGFPLASFPLISVHNAFARVVDSTGRRWMNRPCT